MYATPEPQPSHNHVDTIFVLLFITLVLVGPPAAAFWLMWTIGKPLLALVLAILVAALCESRGMEPATRIGSAFADAWKNDNGEILP